MVKIDSLERLTNPKFVKPVLINYTLNEKKKMWEAVISHDSVSILLWHRDKKALVVVKQFRPPVMNKNKTNGYTYELCAGIVDKDTTNVQIAKEEILEECGYDVDVDTIKEIHTYYTSVGISGSQQTMYYAECDDSMKVNDGGGLEEEEIEVLYIKLEDAKDFMFNNQFQKTPGLMVGFYWFFENIKKL
ncbi:MAG: NUDIX hydrolase [Campylobacterota bacterium]|nr:NUDIX hydrolase [Campylobacterota bacterium]